MSVVFHLILGLSFALLLNTNLLGPTDQGALPGCLRPAVGIHRDDHRHPMAADAQSQRRHQLHAEYAGPRQWTG